MCFAVFDTALFINNLKVLLVVSTSQMQARVLYYETFKGVMTPPILADVTEDGVSHIVLPVFNPSVIVIDGFDFHLFWNSTLPQS